MSFKSFIPATFWLIACTILLMMPGSDLPSEGIFGIENFDKLVHVFLFAVLTFLILLPFIRRMAPASLKSKSFFIAFGVLLYGVAIEFAQEYWASGRSFDGWDILCDATGIILILLLSVSGMFSKKIGPDRNRGRNQN